MRNWEHVVNFKDFWDEDLSIEQKGEQAAIELKEIEKWFEYDIELEDIIDGFEYCDDVKEFDYWMSELYDWADINSVWIKTYF